MTDSLRIVLSIAILHPPLCSSENHNATTSISGSHETTEVSYRRQQLIMARGRAHSN